MKGKKYKVYLPGEERRKLEKLIKTGKHAAQKIIRANLLLYLDENQGGVGSQERIAEQCKVSTALIYKVSRQYAEEGLEATLERKKRETPPKQPIVTGEVEARIIALACEEPPEGRTRWTLRLLEEKVVELQIVDAISDNTIGRLLKKRHLSLT
jgi:transposase